VESVLAFGSASAPSPIVASFLRGWVLELLTIILTFYLLFYLLRDRSAALDWLREISPLTEAEMNRLFRRIVDTVQATLYGTVAVAIVQGALGGLIFWLPRVVEAATLGNHEGPARHRSRRKLGRSLDLAGWGAVVVGGIDNLLYPILVGNRLRLHIVPAFVAVVGGLILFGPAGLVLGPVAVTATIFFLEIWRVRVRRRKPLT